MRGPSHALPRQAAALAATGALVLLAACQAEQRPTGGSVKTIGSPTTGSVSGATGSVSGVTGSVSGVTGSVSGAAAPSPAAKVSPAASPGASPAASAATEGDGIYSPVSNVDAHAAITNDIAEIVQLTNAVQEGKPLPADQILEIYEKGKNSRSGNGFRTLRGFARDPQRAEQFPQAVQFYNSPTFLDDTVIDSIQGTGTAADYTPAQRRQSIQKGLQRILNYWILHELLAAEEKIKAGNTDPATGAPHNVDEAWAFYLGAPQDGKYPNGLSATAASREGNFGREGTIDKPLREALDQARKAALAGNQQEYEEAAQRVRSRLNALFYLASARYLNEALKSVQSGKPETAPAQLIEGLSFYRTIQPTVAQASAQANNTIVSYYQSQPEALTEARRDEALAALNSAAQALNLQQSDLIQPADYE